MHNRQPILRLELEGMKYNLQLMLVEHQMQISQEIQVAIDKFCTPENLQRVIDEQVASSIKNAVESEIADYFRYGPGRAAVRASVLEQLGKGEQA